jgi:hypothetical protein
MMGLCNIGHDTVKGTRGKVSFDSLNVKYGSKLSCYASSEAYLSHLTSKITNVLFIFLSDKYASGEASLDSCEAYLLVKWYFISDPVDRFWWYTIYYVTLLQETMYSIFSRNSESQACVVWFQSQNQVRSNLS